MLHMHAERARRRPERGPRRVLQASGSKACLESWPLQLPSFIPGTPVSLKNLQWCEADREQENKGHPLMSLVPPTLFF